MYKMIKSKDIEKDLNEQYKAGWSFVCFVSFFGNRSILSSYQQILLKKMKGGIK